LAALGLRIVAETDNEIIADGNAELERLKRLTYFECITDGHLRAQTELADIEKRHLQRRPGEAWTRQATRYLVHGIHEYKGKFNPQVVRAFCNILGFEPGHLLLDPFCGSGTSLIEGLALGGNAIGVDASPMAVYLSEAKIAALTHADPAGLAASLREWIQRVVPIIADAEHETRLRREGLVHLSESAVRYLRAWFAPAAFASLSAALSEVHDTRQDCALHQLASIALSSTLRTISLQLPEDLRVRRRSNAEAAPPLGPALTCAVNELAQALDEVSYIAQPRGSARVERSSASTRGLLASLRGKSEATLVVTSPPYATALPYIDTDRLSLVALGIAPPPSLRQLEASLIGSREWDKKEQRRWEMAMVNDGYRLPTAIVRLCCVVYAANCSAGFRRRAVPGLLYRYFVLMRSVFTQLRLALRRDECAVFIVGYNRTWAEDQTFLIDTPALLGSVAEQEGFDLQETVRLETWPRYGLHHENGVRGEAAVILRAN
jgi:site-specific DNA-methyltransferase (cytosine-N4-specific)